MFSSSKQLFSIPSFRWYMQSSDMFSEQRLLLVMMVMTVVTLMVQAGWVCQVTRHIMLHRQSTCLT